MKTLLHGATALCLAALALTTARADFDPSTVPADAKWIVHVDFQNLRNNAFGQELIATIEKAVKANNPAGVQLDIPKTVALLRSATAFGTTFSKNAKDIDGTLILRGADDLRKILEAALLQGTLSSPENVSELKDCPFPAYLLARELTVAFPPGDVILASRSREKLLLAHDLVRGKGGPSLANSPSPLVELIGKKSDLFAATLVPNSEGLFSENAPQTRMLAMTRSASVAFGHDDALTTARVKLLASDDANSDRLGKIIQGLVAMMSLAHTENKELTDFLTSLKTERSGRTITLHLSYPSAVLVKLLHDHERIEKRYDSANTTHTRRNTLGRKIDTWVADQDTGTDSVAPESLLSHTVENVALKSGTLITIAGKRDGGENIRLDNIEITPAAGGTPLRFEAENAVLQRYLIENNRHASGGKLICIAGGNSTANCRFEFPGADGTYTLKIRYVDETDGKSTFTLYTKDPEAEPSAEPAATPQTNAPAAK